MDSPCANYKETGHVTSLAFLAANSAIRSLYCNLVWMQCPFQLVAGQAAQSDSRIVGRRPSSRARPCAVAQLCQHFCPSVTHMNSVLWTTVKSGFIYVPLVFLFPFILPHWCSQIVPQHFNQSIMFHQLHFEYHAKWESWYTIGILWSIIKLNLVRTIPFGKKKKSK